MHYERDGVKIGVSDKFIYLDEIYIKFKEGVSLYKSTYYKSDKPIKLKKKDYIGNKKKSSYLIRFFDLLYAPEDYLINNGFYKANTC